MSTYNAKTAISLAEQLNREAKKSGSKLSFSPETKGGNGRIMMTLLGGIALGYFQSGPEDPTDLQALERECEERTQEL